MQHLEKFLKFVEKMNEKIGKASASLIFVFMLLMVYEVIARYFFESPTIWAHEICGFIFAAYIALTGGWVLLEKGHVAVDIIYQYFPRKAKCIADIAVSITGFFMFGILFWQGYKFAWHAIKTNQHSHTLFAPPMWPVKIMISIGALLFIIQLAANISRSVIDYKNEGGAR
ncbi:MAG: TRAP transporter small permease [Desulfamplus sp.]|nr:TRAP transporter small permease [Desulfamplus sp.]